jgi:putative sugar O-methyltransferase
MADGALVGVEAMTAEMRAAPEIVRPSRFWEYHAELQYRELSEQGGFAEFKRSINQHYFQFLVCDPREPQYRAALRRGARPQVAAARMSEPLEVPPGKVPWLRSPVYGKLYAVYVAAVWEYVRSRDRVGVLERLEEPTLGHPLTVSYRGRRISEDLCNSALELTSMLEALPTHPRTIMELGSGYGRLAWAFLLGLPGVRYVLVDIPPGLAIAQRYLTELFPARPAFRFRHFERHDDIAAELAAAEIVFLTPNQLELIDPLGADLAINVSSLHEMRRDQIAHYFGSVASHCRGHFYTKQWLRSLNPFDEIVVRREEYPVPPTWRAVFDRVHPIQTTFFEALYELHPR